MNMGQSAGRSRGNSVRPAARRRFDENERNRITHPKDDPQQWPDPVNTMMTVSGRILGFIIFTSISCAAFYAAMNWNVGRGFSRGLCIAVIMLSGHLTIRTMSWTTTRRL